jgi:ElaB/YqjD/DUF883 family membrane-anchored ribosome-binding protein
MEEKVMATRRLTSISATVALIAVLGGCATTEEEKPRTPADVMREHASERQQDVELQKEIAKDWDEAKELIESGKQDLKEGREKVEKAEQLMREGQEQIQRGETKIVQGNQQAREARQRFQQHFPGLEIDPQE